MEIWASIQIFVASSCHHLCVGFKQPIQQCCAINAASSKFRWDNLFRCFLNFAVELVFENFFKRGNHVTEKANLGTD